MAATKQSKGARSAGKRGRSQSRSMKPLDQWPIQAVWVEYHTTREDPARNETIRNFLMEKYLPLVRYNAERIYTRLPDEVDIEDLMSAGLFRSEERRVGEECRSR